MNVRSRGEKTFEFVVHMVMIFLCLLVVIPFILLIVGSFTDEAVAVRDGYTFFPDKFSLDAYSYILKEWKQIGQAYLVTAIVTVLGVFLSILVTSTFAFGLTVRDVPGVKVIQFLSVFTMLFNGGLVSTYYCYTNIFHIKNTLAALIVPGLLMSAFNVILVKNYFATNIPTELFDAAEIDGASLFRIYGTIVMPLSTPIIATIGLRAALGYWNSWTNSMYYVTDNRLNTIQYLLEKMSQNIQFLVKNADKLTIANMIDIPSVTVRMAIAVVAVLPIMCIYPFFQKYFAKGLMVGAVKG